MTILRRDLLLAFAANLGSAQGRGSIAFHYEAVFPPDAVTWYTRFETLVTGAVLAAGQMKQLRRNGSRLIAYEWSSGFYPGDTVSTAHSWQSSVHNNVGTWLLSPAASGGGAASPGRTALWYDFGDPGLIAARAEYLATLLRTSGYDGLFFDTPGVEHLPPLMQVAFRQRHPALDYTRCQGEFFAAVRQRIGRDKILFLNQGYRHADEMLPHADFDLTESYFTEIDGANTRFHKWNDLAAPWQGIRTPIEQLVIPASRRFRHVRFIHANYSGGSSALSHRAARYSWAAAKMWNHEAYLIAPRGYANERDEIYFTRVGKPVTPRYQEADGVAWRAYERGVVALNGGSGAVKIPGLGLVLPDPPDGYFFPNGRE